MWPFKKKKEKIKSVHLNKNQDINVAKVEETPAVTESFCISSTMKTTHQFINKPNYRGEKRAVNVNSLDRNMQLSLSVCV